MHVKCIKNKLSEIADFNVRERLGRSIHLDGSIPDLELQKIYSVVALQETDGGIWVVLHTVKASDYPYPYPVELFEIVESTLPNGWCLKFSSQKNGLSIKRIGFSEWVNDDTFYERLLNGDAAAVAIYRRYVKE